MRLLWPTQQKRYFRAWNRACKAAVTNTSEVKQATESLVGKVDAFISRQIIL